jgi:hypothetical protein
MGKQIQVYSISPDCKLRTVIYDCFKSIGRELPIAGGWGRSKDDAIIIDKNDSAIIDGLPFDGVGMEYLIVEKLIYIELIIARPPEDRFSGIKWKLEKQELFTDDNRTYDHLNFTITAHSDRDFAVLKAAYTKHSESADFDYESHVKKHNDLLQHYNRDFWFDITSFYGRN